MRGGRRDDAEGSPNTALLVIDVQNGVVENAHDRDGVIAISIPWSRKREAKTCGYLDPALQ